MAWCTLAGYLPSGPVDVGVMMADNKRVSKRAGKINLYLFTMVSGETGGSVCYMLPYRVYFSVHFHPGWYRATNEKYLRVLT